jgi:short subunit dehydrogenase-like uncharacterized protein
LTVNGTPSGNCTYHSAVNGFARARQTVSAARQRHRLERRPGDRRIHSAPARMRRDAGLGGWVVPLPTIDGSIVRRSAAALDRYGPDFRYGHNTVAKHLSSIVAVAGGAGAAFALAQLPPTRKLVLKAMPSPGEGPSEEVRAKGWFEVTFVGEGGGKRVVTELSGGDPGYSETAKMLAESARMSPTTWSSGFAGRLLRVQCKWAKRKAMSWRSAWRETGVVPMDLSSVITLHPKSTQLAPIALTSIAVF